MRIKKLPALLTFFFILSASDINAFTQTPLDRKISLNLNTLEIRKVLTLIEQRAQISFAYNSQLSSLNNKVSIQADNKKVSQILDHLFNNTDVSYGLSGEVIVLFKKKETPADVVNDMKEPLKSNFTRTSLPPITITGRVQDDDGNGLSGVSVIVKGTTVGTTTNETGNYTITAPSDNGTLVFSFVGFDPYEVSFNKQTVINARLSRDTRAMNEVVIVGYGEQKRANLTGSVSTVNFERLENIPQSNTLNILSGRVSGLSIVQNSGQPGRDGSEVYIRGEGTLNDASPLVIIDGVLSTLRDFGNLTPQEIANVSVLKDASSTAIYGARGANGVILVTTKQPKEGPVKINFNASYGLQSATYIQDFVQSWQWMALHNEATDLSRYPTYAIENLRNGIVSDTFANTRWMNEIFRTAPISNYTLSVSGRNRNLSFQGTLGYLQQEGILRGTNSSRINFRTNVTARLSERLETGINLWGNRKKVNEPFEGPSFIIQKALTTWPVIPVKNSNGDWGVSYSHPSLSSNIGNPLLWTQLGRADENNITGNIQSFLQLKPVAGLNLRTSFTYSYGNGITERFNPTFSYPNLNGVPTFVNNLNELVNSSSGSEQIQLQTTANYDKTFSIDHNIKLLIGHEFTNFSSNSFSAGGNNLPNNDQQVLSRALSNYVIGGSKQEWALQSFFSRMNYGFRDKYLLEGNIRIDGSSRFPESNKYGFFPSFSAGWVLSQEEFFQKGLNKNNFFNHLKIRGGWGKVGNDRIGNYSYSQQLNLSSYYNFGNNLTTGAAITSFANPQISWESSTTTNFGLDASLLKNKILLNFDMFKRLTDGILYRLPLPPSIGAVNPAILNIADVSNNGWELNIEHRNRTKSFNYHIGFNIAYVNNKVVNLSSRQAIDDRFILREGVPIRSYYGFVYEGLFRDSAELAKFPAFSTNGLVVGSMRFKDLNGDGKIDAEDRQVIGSANTPYTFGLPGGFSFKGFDLNFLFQGVQGKYIFLYDAGNRPGNAANANFWKEWWDNRFDPVENPTGTWPLLKRTAPESAETSTFWLRDASYVRLKNIEFGYNLPAKVLRKLHMNNLRFYVAAQNILTFSNLIKQVDPERSSTRTDNQNHPQVKSINFGINSSF